MGHRTTSLIDPFAWKMCVGVESEEGQEDLCSGGIEGLESQAKQPESGLNSAYHNGVCISFEHLSTCRAKGQIQIFFFFFEIQFYLKILRG